MSFREFLGLKPTNEAKEPDLSKIEITNLPAHLKDAEMQVMEFMPTHFFVEFQTEPKLNARVSYLATDGEEAANERPIDDKDIDLSKAVVQSFYIQKGEDFENVPEDDVTNYKVPESV